MLPCRCLVLLFFCEEGEEQTYLQVSGHGLAYLVWYFVPVKFLERCYVFGVVSVTLYVLVWSNESCCAWDCSVACYYCKFVQSERVHSPHDVWPRLVKYAYCVSLLLFGLYPHGALFC
jgi:hypothetical protein